MTQTLESLTAFLSGPGLPVYLEGQAPAGAAFPCAEYGLELGGDGVPGALRVTGWHRGPGANRSAAAFLDAMAALVPEGGVLLTLPESLLMISRAERFRAVVTDRDAVGGRATLEVTRYGGD